MGSKLPQHWSGHSIWDNNSDDVVAVSLKISVHSCIEYGRIRWSKKGEAIRWLADVIVHGRVTAWGKLYYASDNPQIRVNSSFLSRGVAAIEGSGFVPRTGARPYRTQD